MYNKNSVLFIGGFFTRKSEIQISKYSKKNVQNAANILQWNIIDGICDNFDGDMTFITTPYIGTYPINYKQMYLKGDIFEYRTGKIEQLEFVNVLGAKNYSIYFNLKKAINEWINSHKNNVKVIIFYSIQNYYMELANWIKSKNKGIHIHIVIPDLPHYMYLDRQHNLFYKVKVNRQIKMCEKYIGLFDSYTVLTKQIAKKLKLKENDYVVVEGMVNSLTEGEKGNSLNTYGRYCLYSGTLTAEYGIMDLIKEFNKIKSEDLKLIICGEGETKDDILEYAQKNENIIYLGLVDRFKIKKLQKNALFLINPRKNNDTFAKYSFPSKTMEYLQSGRPVLCYKLDGIPEEYDEFLKYFDFNDSDSMRNIILQYSAMSEDKLSEIGLKGKIFVETYKTNNMQVKKIKRLICKKINLVGD